VCGIAGVLRRGGVDPAWLVAMSDALAHRGPDGQGTRCLDPIEFGGDRWQAGFAHRRLAIFDPTPAGAQPMTSRSGRTTLVLNGEIYNHPELRRRLPSFPWRTSTDAEVFLELFERHGPAMLNRVHGMFAFAVYRRDDGRLWLGRDRLGIKPLFYRLDKDGLIFASELRAMTAGPPFPRRVDPAAMSAYLDFGFVPAPMTALEGVAKLPPGHLLEWCDGDARERRWWSLPAPAEKVPDGWREDLYARLVQAVRLHLRSDVPVGCFLSGGVDSTLLAALALRERGQLTTFSVGFPEAPALDETRFARAAARALGTDHVELAITGPEIRREAPSILSAMDEPLADSSLLPTHLLARAARARVTVAVAGDGADELFAGYRRYSADRWLARWRWLPAVARRRLLAPLLGRLREDRSRPLGELVRRVHRVIDLDGLPEAERAFALMRIFSAAEKESVAPQLRAHEDVGRSLLSALRTREGGADELDAQLRMDLCLGLPDDMLVKVDRASMAHGLEVRVPFLDHRVVEHAAALPTALKRGRGSGKAALLEVFGASLPAATRRRRKRGFDAPLTTWLRGPLRELMRDTLAPSQLARTAHVDAEAVERMMNAHERGEVDCASRLFGLMAWVGWAGRQLGD
jgi:asparagine synthase (glutamine-hydrolysing)